MNTSEIAIAEYDFEKAMQKLNLFEGVVNSERIISELDKSSLSIFPKVTIMDNNQFSMVYDHRTRQINLNTTYSNLEINEEFLKKAELLNNLKEELTERIIKVLIENEVITEE